ncbi:MAG TPA: PDDEXK nuclease domain-containing protein [Deltaproteobacteria bacterium]|nr:PDDEXK nuclease domain-containing protein [Deltaproteobacteria bacterium]HQB38959.1 PDDEXK nuclease domain-containing protein [Deltaproteobacteria bacterium]
MLITVQTAPVAELAGRIAGIIETARKRIQSVVDHEMVRAYWEIGREIVEDEQQGEQRAEYGKALIENLAKELTATHGKGFTASNLLAMRRFYLNFPIQHALRAELSWTHYRQLLKIEEPQKRSFYEIESANCNWSTRELDRQMNSMLFERLALSLDKDGVMALAREGQVMREPVDMVKDPYVLEFLGIPQSELLYEKELETALLEHLQKFLLELGKGFSFVARQKRITLDGDHFFIDLVFYNYILKCFVLIDLKIGKLSHQDMGQMQMYVNYYTREMMNEGDNPPIGILLCETKSDAVVRYTLPEGDKQIFASRYKLYLPTEDELRAELTRDRKLIKQHHDSE